LELSWEDVTSAAEDRQQWHQRVDRWIQDESRSSQGQDHYYYSWFAHPPHKQVCKWTDLQSSVCKQSDTISYMDPALTTATIYMYKGIGNCAISSLVANQIVTRLYTWTR